MSFICDTREKNLSTVHRLINCKLRIRRSGIKSGINPGLCLTRLAIIESGEYLSISVSSKVGLDMNHSAKAYAVSICLICALATPALAQPPDPVNSDDNANTAVGSYTLWNVQPDEGGCHNTASGYVALFSLTT